uniref:Glucosamine 6-phosphate N-acetyltransferase n=1 Tax=Steinernema glaseri TaxID=37863 RepID=A0A1I7ZBG0_9BILA
MDESLFPGSILDGIVPSLPDGLCLRPLQLGDYHKGYLTVLESLTVTGEYTFEVFEKQFRAMKTSTPHRDYIVVIEDLSTGKIVGSATLEIGMKFIRGAALRGRIEDVVVAPEKRGLKLGAVLLECLNSLSEKLTPYKVSLECRDKLIDFYGRFGFRRVGNNYLEHERRFG